MEVIGGFDYDLVRACSDCISWKRYDVSLFVFDLGGSGEFVGKIIDCCAATGLSGPSSKRISCRLFIGLLSVRAIPALRSHWKAELRFYLIVQAHLWEKSTSMARVSVSTSQRVRLSALRPGKMSATYAVHW